jgi:hypothetical protein
VQSKGGSRRIRSEPTNAVAMSWEAVTALGTAFTALVIVATAVVGLGQLNVIRRQRQDSAAVELVRSLQDDGFIRAYNLVFSLPAGITATDLRELGTSYVDAGVVLGFRFEMLGVLVFKGVIPFAIVEDLAGGLVLGAWKRLEDSVRATRRDKHWPGYLEWFQWLAEQFERRGRLDQTPAFERITEWNQR